MSLFLLGKVLPFSPLYSTTAVLETLSPRIIAGPSSWEFFWPHLLLVWRPFKPFLTIVIFAIRSGAEREPHAPSENGLKCAYKIGAMTLEILIPPLDMGSNGQDTTPCAVWRRRTGPAWSVSPSLPRSILWVYTPLMESPSTTKRAGTTPSKETLARTLVSEFRRNIPTLKSRTKGTCTPRSPPLRVSFRWTTEIGVGSFTRCRDSTSSRPSPNVYQQP